MTLHWLDDQEYMTYVRDILYHPEVQRLDQFVHHKFTTRLEHSIMVSYLCYRWAKRLGLDARSTARAGLLHDLFFYEGCNKKQVGGRGHNYEHPRIALKNAEALFDLNDLERDIILKHMCGSTRDIPKYKESWIVTMMDKQAAVMEISLGAWNFLKVKKKQLSSTEWNDI